MAYQIIKQPNGRYALFSSVVDNFIMFEAEPEDIVKFFVDEKIKSVEEYVKLVIGRLNKGEKPYHQFTKTFEEALETIAQTHGTAERQKIEESIK